MDIVIKPHDKKSREVTDTDIDRVIEDAQKMFKLCVNGCIALAHSQIEDKDPLRFFVTPDKIFINPVITRSTKAFVKSEEGCRTFSGKEPVQIDRHYRIEFEFQVIDMHRLSEIQKAKVKGLSAFVVQHEIDHMDAKYIY